jgi:hypothetical protein
VKKILVATDYSKEARNALLFALDMACRAQAEIVLFHAFHQREEIARGIQDFLQARQADLLALVPKPHTFLDILRQHTFTGLMTQKATVPLLALPYTPAARQAVTTGKEKSRHLSQVPGK